MRLVVGLGNPGSEYAGTRHNIGWEVVDRFAARLAWSQKPAKKFDGLFLDGTIGSEKLLLLKPLTYMNASGKSVAAAMNFYQLSPAELLIVLDDLALPCGKIRLRQSGSSGGHNGLRDIEQAIASSDYPRLRIGIDAAPPPIAGKDYVLGKFSAEQRVKIEPAVDRAASAILTWIENGIVTAMNRFNAESPLPPGEGQGEGI
ncbi:MAG TPA: aminoacyl-tRNA hydrolase [Tepidisphaeraceae bacterium]